MDKKEALKIVQESGYEFSNLPDEFKKDKEVVLAAAKQYGGSWFWVCCTALRVLERHLR